MKKIWFLVLMMVLPLQSLWASAEAYHVHNADSSSVILDILHTHGADGHTDHDQHASGGDDTSTPQNTCNPDHPNHHCHAHGAAVLPDTTFGNQPDLRHDESSVFIHRALPRLTNRIERPNWC